MEDCCLEAIEELQVCIKGMLKGPGLKSSANISLSSKIGPIGGPNIIFKFLDNNNNNNN